jgi:anti-anti-sigma factor
MTVIDLPSAAGNADAVFGAQADADQALLWMWGEHDLVTAAGLRAVLDLLIDAWPRNDLTIDLRGVDFMDASTIGVFASARARLAARSRRLDLRAPSPWAVRLLDLCGIPAISLPGTRDDR